MKLRDLLSQKLNPNFFYFILPCGIGDAFIVSNLLERLEQKYRSKIIIILPDNLEAIMKMNQVKDYILFDSSDFYYQKANWSQLFYNIGRDTPTPKLGKFFVCQPMYILDNTGKCLQYNGKPFLNWYARFFGLEEDIKLDISRVIYPEINQNTRSIIENKTGFNIEDLILFLPDATSINPLPQSFWNQVIQSLIKEGYTKKQIIQNRSRSVLNQVESFQLSLEQTIALALSCKKVYSLRSGICDVLFKKDKDLIVFFTDQITRGVYSLNSSYGVKNVQEIWVN